MTQFFKGDSEEKKYYFSGKQIGDDLFAQKSLFFDDAYACFLLGELLYDTERAPLANAIPRAIFRESFSTIFDAFVEAGTFESYLTVFRNIFGEDVDVVFTVPGPGLLNIDITAAGFVLSDFITQGGEEVITQDGDNISFQSVKGFESQYELEQMLHEMVPNGIFTEITLSITPAASPLISETGDSFLTETGDTLILE